MGSIGKAGYPPMVSRWVRGEEGGGRGGGWEGEREGGLS